jgi:hypothetical protein
MAFKTSEFTVIQKANFAAFPAVGVKDFLYIDISSSYKGYLWDTLTASYKFLTAVDPAAITSADQATEIEAGIAEIATQAETDAGIDDNRIITPLKLKNFSGLAFSAVSFWSIYSATTNGAWHEITIADAAPNSWVNMIMCNPTNNDTFGVRAVGSALESKCAGLSDTTFSIMVKTDLNSKIEAYTGDMNNTDFIFSTQF